LISQRAIPAPYIDIFHIKKNNNNENKAEKELGIRAQIPIENQSFKSKD
jgi:hypothetical protein